MAVYLSKQDFDNEQDATPYRSNKLRELAFGDCPHVGIDENCSNISTPSNLCLEILNKLPNLNNKNICILFNPEFLILIHDKYPTVHITMLTGSKRAADMYWGKYIDIIHCDPYNINNVENALKDKNNNKKFDVIIGYPPYNKKGKGKGTAPNYKSKIYKGYAYVAFTETCFRLLSPDGFINFILPTNFMTLKIFSSFRKWMINNTSIDNLYIYNNSKKELFNMPFENISVLTLSPLNNNKITQYGRQNYKTNEWQYFDVDLSKHEIWPLYLDKINIDIFNKVISKRQGPIKFKTEKANPQELKYFIHMPVQGCDNSDHHTKSWVLNTIRDNIKWPIYFCFDTLLDSELYYEFTQTPLYNLLLNIVKSTPKNQPGTLTYIGYYDFNNNNFNEYFNLTDEEIKYINEK